MSPVREAVESTVGQDGVVEAGDPFVHGPIGGEDRRGPAMALDEDVVEVARLLGREFAEPEVVELCGAPHNSTYGERSVMWSAASRPEESALL